MSWINEVLDNDHDPMVLNGHTNCSSAWWN